MRNWKVLVGLLAFAVVAPAGFAQTADDLSRDLQELKERVAALEKENRDLKASVVTQDDALLESQINGLTERLAAGTTVKSAANPVTLSGEFRFRNSWSLGDNYSSSPSDGFGDPEHEGFYTDALVRLGFLYDFTREVTAFAELQAHWAFGDLAPTDTTETFQSMRLHQGWVEVRNLFDRPEFSSKTGRQEIVLGHQFQFGNADWYNGWAFDATRWDWNSESFSLTGIIAQLTSFDGDFNQFPSFQLPHDDDELYTLYFTLKTIKNHQLDLYWIYINGHGGAPSGSGVSVGSLGTNFVGSQMGSGMTAYYHTLGGRIGGVFPDIAAGLDWNAEFAYQFGDQKTGSGNMDIDAFAFEGEVGVTFNKENMFRVFARLLWAEGPDSDSTGYIPLFPNRHSNGGFRARYGVFDLIPMTNVLSLQGGLHFDPDPSWTLGGTVVWATTDDVSGSFTNILPVPSGSSPVIPDEDYGFEIDVWGEYRYSDHLVFNGGVAFFFTDEAIEAYWGLEDDTQFFGYIQARLLF